MSNDIAIRVQNIGKRFELGELGTARDLYRRARRLGRKLLAPGPGSGNGTTSPAPWDHETDPDAFWALKGVDFEVKHGEVLGIIGHNGAGKSTLLKILSRITAPTCGRIEVFGRIAALLEVGTGFHAELTGRENIYLNGSILGMTRREITAKLDEIVDFSGVEKFLDTPVKRYSSGMKVRLGFAVAAHLEPEILIVDEVLAVGDAAFQQRCISKMEDVARSDGRTVLFVSHNMGSVQRLCTRAFVLTEGIVEYDGSTEHAVRSYLRGLHRTSNLPIAERPDRAGMGPGRIERIEINGQDVDAGAPTIHVGGAVQIIFGLRSAEGSYSPSFTLWTEDGQCVAAFDGRRSLSDEAYGFSGSQTFVCEISEFPLVPGDYRMKCGLWRSNDLIDSLEAATVIRVEEGVVGNSRVSQGDRGYVHVPHRWSAGVLTAVS